MLIVVDNDGNVSAIAEHRVGAGVGTDSMVSITIGTGIGSGLIIGGKLVRGVSGFAGEIGHMSINHEGPICDCGNRGCLEAYVSGPAMIRMILDGIKKKDEISILRLVNNDVAAISPRTIGLAARQGDKLALAVIEKTSHYLGVGLANLVNILRPEAIVIGGGIAQLQNLLFDRVRRVTAERIFGVASDELRILPSKLGPHAGVIGAALLAFENVELAGNEKGGM